MTRQEDLAALGLIWDQAEYDRDKAIADLATLQTEFDAYKLSHPDPASPVITFLGYAPDPNTPTEVKRLAQFSGAQVRRSYKPPGQWPVNPTFATDAANGLRTAHTIKTPVPPGEPDNMQNRMLSLISGAHDEATINYILNSGPDSIFGHEHEPEDDYAQNRTWDKGIYREGQRKGKALLVEANARDGGRRRYAGNLMSSTTEPLFLTFYPGDGVWDIYGTDGYNWPNRTPGDTTIPRWVEFEEIFTPDKAIANKYGMDFAIFEFGCRKADLFNTVNNDERPTAANSARQVDWLQKAGRVMCETLHPVVACYFHHDWWLLRREGHEAMRLPTDTP